MILLRKLFKYNLSIALLFLLTASCKKDKVVTEIKLQPYKGPLKFSFIKGSIEKIFSAEMPWESKTLNYFNVLKKDSKWYMWYNSFGKGELDFSGSFCLASSVNGKNWNRVFKNDSTNILISGKQEQGIGETCVFMDSADVNTPYKMICTRRLNGTQRTFIYSSPNGTDWQSTKELYNMFQDTQFSVISLKGTYYIFSRYNDFSSGYQRAIGLSTIDNNLNALLPPTLSLSADANSPYRHIYNNAASKINDSTILLFPTYYDDNTNGIQLKLLYTKNLKDYYLVKNSIYVDLFPEQKAKWAIVSPGLVPTNEEKDTYWLYYYGTPYKHDDFKHSPNLDVTYYRIKLRVHL